MCNMRRAMCGAQGCLAWQGTALFHVLIGQAAYALLVAILVALLFRGEPMTFAGAAERRSHVPRRSTARHGAAWPLQRQMRLQGHRQRGRRARRLRRWASSLAASQRWLWQ
jgi:hypothetical protein